jgi:peptidoglycan/LPS O-acetylase OafA/YrhL
MTWLLIFGCIGFSQHFFDRESRFWRYFSDSSYWFYLAHLPIQFQMLIWLGDKPWPWAFKFSAYVFGTVAVLLPSYHFLVRPTWIGWFLNGRMASVWKSRAAAESRADVSSTVVVDVLSSSLELGMNPSSSSGLESSDDIRFVKGESRGDRGTPNRDGESVVGS